MELMEEGVGESSSPPRWLAAQDPSYDIKNDIYMRLVESKNPEAIANPNLRDLIDAHFSRLPASYGVDINVDRAEDVLLHWKLLADAKAEKRPFFHVRFMKSGVDWSDEQQLFGIVSTSRGYDDYVEHEEELSSNFSYFLSINRDCGFDFEHCSKLEELNLDAGKIIEDTEDGRSPIDALSARDDGRYTPIHEIIISTVDKPKILSRVGVEILA